MVVSDRRGWGRALEVSVKIYCVKREYVVFFFFQAEDGIRDYWSSDVCSSDLVALVALAFGREERGRIRRRAGRRYAAQHLLVLRDLGAAGDHVAEPDREQEKARQDEPAAHERRSEERRVGEEGRSRWSPDH